MKTNLEAYLNDLDACILPKDKKMIKAVPLSLLEEKSELEVARFLQTDSSSEHDILTGIYNEIDEEKHLLMKEATAMYFTKSNYSEFGKEGLSPKEIWELLSNMALRINRLMLVYRPDYYKSVAANKAGGEKYELIKINWLDDSGKKFIKVTRSYGKHGSKGLENAIPKLLESYFGDILTDYQYNFRLRDKVIIDFVAQLNDKQWAFEFKATNKINFIETAIRLELWKIYRETYLNK